MAIISEAFDPFLAESGPNDRREAIIIYKTPESAVDLRARRRKRMSANQKKRFLRDLAEVQAPSQKASLRNYKKAGRARLPKRDKTELMTSAAGPMEGSMPFAYVEVTPENLRLRKRVLSASHRKR